MLIIRKFKDSDSVELAKMHKSTIRNVNSQDYNKNQIKVWSDKISAEKYERTSKEKNRIILVAIERRKIVGYGEYLNKHIVGLYISKNNLGKGIGKKLLQKLEAHAYKKGIRTIKCYSTITAHKFYEKNGYKTIKKNTKYKLGNQKLTVFEMKKRLINDN